jgi:hypothetical protein
VKEWDAALATLRAAGWPVEMTCGAAPGQLEGVLPCGELFYFRSRHDEVEHEMSCPRINPTRST